MTSKHISFPRSEGRSSRQAHADLPAGTFEREVGREGFFGPATHIYHSHPPTAWLKWEGPLRPHAFDLPGIRTTGSTLWEAPVVVHNAHVQMRYWRLERRMDHLVRNADGDDLIFVHQGSGHIFCDYGHLAIGRGDYLLLPRSTMWRIEGETPITLLLFESTNASVRAPDRGILGRHALYDEAVLDTPRIDEAFRQQYDEREWRVLVKRQGAVSTITYPFNPLDAVGWHGDLIPVRLNVKDIRPVNSHRYHLPPSAHTTWVSDRFVICTFSPRPFETDPAAIKVPFFHNNDDYDEVVFYHDGDFFSRDHIRPGMVTWHPAGFTHGPHPKALSRMYDAPGELAMEYAVMLDARDPLSAGDAVASVEIADYPDSWRTTRAQVPVSPRASGPHTP